MSRTFFMMGVSSKGRRVDAPPAKAIQSRMAGFLASAVLWGGTGFSLPCAAEIVTVRQFQLGMMMTLTVATEDPAAAREASRTAFLRTGELSRVFSDYDPESEISRLVRQPPGRAIPLSPDLRAVWLPAQTLAELSHGRFTVTAGPLTQLWRQARREESLPAPEALAHARERAAWTNVAFTAAAEAVILGRPDLRLDFGGIAKGHLLDQALAHLRERGFPSALAEAGGDLVLGDAPPGEPGWRVELPDPGPGWITTSRVAVAISADWSQGWLGSGVRRSHVIDADTGQALTNRVAAVVLAERGLWADALATLATLVEPEEWTRIAAATHPPARLWRGVVTDPPR
jgi:thiamine biosynthesis lipoprotein